MHGNFFFFFQTPMSLFLHSPGEETLLAFNKVHKDSVGSKSGPQGSKRGHTRLKKWPTRVRKGRHEAQKGATQGSKRGHRRLKRGQTRLKKGPHKAQKGTTQSSKRNHTRVKRGHSSPKGATCHTYSIILICLSCVFFSCLVRMWPLCRSRSARFD